MDNLWINLWKYKQKQAKAYNKKVFIMWIMWKKIINLIIYNCFN